MSKWIQILVEKKKVVVGLLKRRAALVCVTNRKTAQKVIPNRNEFRSKPKTVSKIRWDVVTVEVVEVHIFGRETRKTPNRIAV